METMSNLFKLKILNKEISLVGLFLSKYGKIILHRYKLDWQSLRVNLATPFKNKLKTENNKYMYIKSYF